MKVTSTMVSVKVIALLSLLVVASAQQQQQEPRNLRGFCVESQVLLGNGCCCISGQPVCGDRAAENEECKEKFDEYLLQRFGNAQPKPQPKPQPAEETPKTPQEPLVLVSQQAGGGVSTASAEASGPTFAGLKDAAANRCSIPSFVNLSSDPSTHLCEHDYECAEGCCAQFGSKLICLPQEMGLESLNRMFGLGLTCRGEANECGGGAAAAVTNTDTAPVTSTTTITGAETGEFDIIAEDDPEDAAPATKSIVEIASGNDDFSTLVAAVSEAGLVDALSGDGPLTVFAPTNEAFANLADGTLEFLLLPENKQQLVDILTYHVVSGSVRSSTLEDGEAETLNGASITISTKDGVKINDANVVTADIVATNGIIHVLDKVLLPPLDPPSDEDEDAAEVDPEAEEVVEQVLALVEEKNKDQLEAVNNKDKNNKNNNKNKNKGDDDDDDDDDDDNSFVASACVSSNLSYKIPSVGTAFTSPCCYGDECVSGLCAASSGVRGACVDSVPGGWKLREQTKPASAEEDEEDGDK